MTTPRRLLECDATLPTELSRALRAAPAEPAAGQLRELAGGLSAMLGVPVALPIVASPVAPLVAAPATASAPVATGVAAAKPLAAFGVWVLGGVALGVGLSGVASYSSAAFDGPTPAISAHPSTASPRGELPVAAPVAVAAPAPIEVEPSPGRPVAATAAAPSASDVVESVEAVPEETELSLLRRARAAVGSKPADALQLSSRHAREFPSGLLVQEREVIAIDALVRLGRNDEARARAARFVEHYPGSAHVPLLRALLPGGAAQ